MRRALPILAFLIACGGGGTGAGDVDTELRDATCRYQTRCGSFTSEDECRTYYDRSRPSDKSLTAAVDHGRIAFDADQLDACIAAYDALPCDTTQQDLSACSNIFTGTVPENGDCAFDLECTSGRCIVPDCLDACCTGSCGPARPYPGLDEPCSSICAESLYCGYDGICHAPLPANAPCGIYDVCDAGLYCRPSTMLCEPVPHLGEPCETVCAEEGSTCNASAQCVAAGTEGDPCTATGDCSNYYVCNPDAHTCTLMPELMRSDNGTPCDVSTQCKSHYCNLTCQEPPVCY
jgi:hypothetical protein